MEVVGGTEPVRGGRWTPEKRAAFLVRLAETGNVRRSLREVSMSAAAVYRLRQRSATFRAEWDAVLEGAYASLELSLVVRARDGDEATAAQTEKLALGLLSHRRGGTASGGAATRGKSDDGARSRVLARLEAMSRRVTPAAPDGDG